MARSHRGASRRDRGAARPVVVGLIGVVVVAVLAAVAVVVLTSLDDSDGPGGSPAAAARAAADRFVAAVDRGAPNEGGTVQTPDEVLFAFTSTTQGLGELHLEATAGEVTLAEDEESAIVPLEVAWTVSGATWNTQGELRLVPGEPDPERPDAPIGWLADFSISALDARLRPGDTLSVVETETERGAILDGAGEPLVAQTPVVVVGVVPSAVPDVAALSAELARLLGLDAAELEARISGAPEDQFVEIITLRRADYDAIRDQIRPLPGTRFREDTELLAGSRNFARPILGSIGPADEEDVADAEGRVQLGDLIGQSGVQRRYDERLAGVPGLEVRVTRAVPAGADPSTTTAPDTPPEVNTLETVMGTPGQTVQLTLDRAAQEAAEAALAGDERVTALVAVRVSTSEVLAAATGPTGSAQNIAFNGQVAPGSTFKVVSSLAHLRQGLTPDTVVPCPETATGGGQPFRNAGGFVLGDVPFREDFAQSCNTAFVNLSPNLADDELHRTAMDFGLGVEWDAGLGANTGSVPVNDSAADKAAASIGQARVQVSPLGMAMVAATVAAGRWRAPRIVADPAPEGQPAEVPLAEGEVAALREMMRAVVLDGTATGSLGGVPGEVFAKTGTAEFGSGEDLQTNAWIVGWRGDIAFCVFVEGGAGGGSVAGPIAAAFLNAYGG